MSDEALPINRLRAALVVLGLPEERMMRLLEAVEGALRIGAIEQLLLRLAPNDIQDLQQTLLQGAGESELLIWLRGRIPELDAAMRAYVSEQVDGIVGALEAFEGVDSPSRESYLCALEKGQLVLYD